LLSSKPGYAGQSVYNIYAEFSSPLNQAVGVVGTPSHPFSIFVQGQSAAFYNSAGASGNDAPSATEAQFINDINWDSFYTIGKKLEPYSTPLIVAPGTPGPTSTGKWGGGAIGMNMAWTLPPTTPQGAPTPETLAVGGRVLLMRLAVNNQAKVIQGSFGVLIFDENGGAEVGGEFKTILLPAPGALALLGLAGLAGFSRRRRS
jgi:hypothetical protein